MLPRVPGRGGGAGLGLGSGVREPCVKSAWSFCVDDGGCLSECRWRCRFESATPMLQSCRRVAGAPLNKFLGRITLLDTLTNPD